MKLISPRVHGKGNRPGVRPLTDEILAGPRSTPFHLDNFTSVVGSTVRTGMMWQLGAVALRTLVKCRWFYGVMTTPFTNTRLA